MGDSANQHVPNVTESGGNSPRSLILAVLLTSLFWVITAGALLFLWRRPEPVTFEIQPPPATATPMPTSTPQPSPTPGPIVVDVAGAVRRPGVYDLPQGSRVQQAIEAAGGLTGAADSRGISLARLLSDGEKLYVPAVGEVPPPPTPALNTSSSGASSTPQTTLAFPININTATAEDLQALPGIGPVTAAAIVAYREEHGVFAAIEDIVQVKGIGEGTLTKIRGLISVD